MSFSRRTAIKAHGTTPSAENKLIPEAFFCLFNCSPVIPRLRNNQPADSVSCHGPPSVNFYQSAHGYAGGTGFSVGNKSIPSRRLRPRARSERAGRAVVYDVQLTPRCPNVRTNNLQSLLRRRLTFQRNPATLIFHWLKFLPSIRCEGTQRATRHLPPSRRETPNSANYHGTYFTIN